MVGTVYALAALLLRLLDVIVVFFIVYLLHMVQVTSVDFVKIGVGMELQVMVRIIKVEDC